MLVGPSLRSPVPSHLPVGSWPSLSFIVFDEMEVIIRVTWGKLRGTVKSKEPPLRVCCCGLLLWVTWLTPVLSELQQGGLFGRERSRGRVYSLSKWQGCSPRKQRMTE